MWQIDPHSLSEPYYVKEEDKAVIDREMKCYAIEVY